MPEHICSHGLRCKDLLKRQGLRWMTNTLLAGTEVEALKALHNVSTVPQIFIDETRIGGFDDLLEYFGKT